MFLLHVANKLQLLESKYEVIERSEQRHQTQSCSIFSFALSAISQLISMSIRIRIPPVQQI